MSDSTNKKPGLERITEKEKEDKVIACENIRSPRSSPLGTFCAEEHLRLSDRNSVLMTQNLSGIRSEALVGRRSSYIVLAIVYE